MNKIILISEPPLIGKGKLRISIFGENFLMEIVDKALSIPEKKYNLLFSLEKKEEEDKGLTLDFLLRLTEKLDRDRNNITTLHAHNLESVRDIEDKIYHFSLSQYSKDNVAVIFFTAKQRIFEIKRGYMPRTFSFIEKAFQNVDWVPLTA